MLLYRLLFLGVLPIIIVSSLNCCIYRAVRRARIERYNRQQDSTNTITPDITATMKVRKGDRRNTVVATLEKCWDRVRCQTSTKSTTDIELVEVSLSATRGSPAEDSRHSPEKRRPEGKFIRWSQWCVSC